MLKAIKVVVYTIITILTGLGTLGVMGFGWISYREGSMKKGALTVMDAVDTIDTI
jgi:hypothetical protein